MNFTDLFIKRPVLAVVVSLVILLLGLRALADLDLRQFPEIEETTITVTTVYPGASADLIQGFITTPLQQAVATADGIDYINATSSQSFSSISVHLKLGEDPDDALTQVIAKVNEVRNTLPPESESPVVQAGTGRRFALMYLSFFSDKMDEKQITDYLTRVVQPRLETTEGVAQAQIFGAKNFAMRVWLDPQKMAALGIAANDVTQALRANNFLSAAGSTKGANVAININATTDLTSVEDFGAITVRRDGDRLVRLRDVARIELGAEDYESSVIFNGKKAIFMGIFAAPEANPLDAIGAVRTVLPEIQAQLPESLEAEIGYDATRFISASIDEVVRTVIEATLIVVVVVFLFLGSFRSVVIPIVTIPLSLVGVLFFMLMLGYSINLLTLLAMVLAIGLVVDDAIVVVENTHRHIEEGKSPYESALLGAREIAGPVIAMTLTLAAVYAPIGFLGGVTGGLFKEFAFTLAGAVIISGIIALTLSPMMASRLLEPHGQESGFVKFLDRQFERLKQAYLRRLHGSLDYRASTFLVAGVVALSCVVFYQFSRKELAPLEDQGFIFVIANGPQNATLEYMERYTTELDRIYKAIPESERYFMINGAGAANNSMSGTILKPWSERERTQAEIHGELQGNLGTVAGLRSFAIQFPALPSGGDGLPVQFVLTSTLPHAQLAEAAQTLMAEGMKSGRFMFLDADLKFEKPKLNVHIDRNKAATLGVSIADIGQTLATLLGGNYVNRFAIEGRSYKVIPQVEQGFRLNADQLDGYYVRAADGQLVPLASVVTLSTEVQPNSLSQFQQLNAVTIQGMAAYGTSLGDALTFLNAKAREVLPSGYGTDYAGQSRAFMQEGAALLYTFFFALIIIFLVLAAQFESFRDPLIVLVTVPLSMFGALLPLFLGFASVNIYTQVGLVTLIGLISKHGILMVEFANQLQAQRGLGVRAAIEEAAAVRLRPILMTTAAMVLGVLPLLIASGAGAASRFNIGVVIFMGMLVGTAFTLFVVPAFYTLIAAPHAARETPGAGSAVPASAGH
jgi:multidrug efflux pump